MSLREIHAYEAIGFAIATWIGLWAFGAVGRLGPVRRRLAAVLLPLWALLVGAAVRIGLID